MILDDKTKASIVHNKNYVYIAIGRKIAFSVSLKWSDDDIKYTMHDHLSTFYPYDITVDFVYKIFKAIR